MTYRLAGRSASVASGVTQVLRPRTPGLSSEMAERVELSSAGRYRHPYSQDPDVTLRIPSSAYARVVDPMQSVAGPTAALVRAFRAMARPAWRF